MNNRILYLLFFLSGFSALIYEVVWLRKLELVFGTTTYAVSTVLAVFFTGLAVGSYLFGKIVDKNNFQFSIFNFQSIFKLLNFQKIINHKSLIINPLVLYGLLELGIGVYAALTPWIFIGIEQAQAYVWQQFVPSYGGFSVVTFGLSFVGLFVPTMLMGGTFPVVVGAATRLHLRGGNESTPRRWDTGGKIIGWLYGLNTLGAVLGVLTAGFFLIASFGVNQTIWLAAGISLVVGGIAIYISSKFKVQSEKLQFKVKSYE